tara:strand:+ start:1217 stop:1900 length:684 start_codon:yes stop_codon:yes gene_type:complete
MNRRALVLSTTILALVAFSIAGLIYRGYGSNEAATISQSMAANQQVGSVQSSEALVRPHSPVLGPRDARVTIVEFFDPSCEACRAYYPVVKQAMARYPRDVRLVIRYAPLHVGSEEAVRILETARLQGVYVPVLEAILASQPEWHNGDMTSAWSAAEGAGLDIARARAALQSPQINTVLQADFADLQTLGVKGTPTFFVNGKLLTDFGEQQFRELVRAAVDDTGRRQ